MLAFELLLSMLVSVLHQAHSALNLDRRIVELDSSSRGLAATAAMLFAMSIVFPAMRLL